MKDIITTILILLGLVTIVQSYFARKYKKVVENWKVVSKSTIYQLYFQKGFGTGAIYLMYWEKWEVKTTNLGNPAFDKHFVVHGDDDGFIQAVDA